MNRVLLPLVLNFGLAWAVEVRAFDTPNDGGRSVTISWQPSPEEGDPARFLGYEICRAEAREGPFERVGWVASGSTQYEDKGVEDGKEYYYLVVALGAEERVPSEVVGPVCSSPQWFNLARLNVLVFVLLVGGLVVYYIDRARRGVALYIRRIAGLDAIDDAVGRATELGRPILFSFGLGYLTDVVTIAALSILRRVARRAAQYETRLLVPNYDPLVMATAQETVKEAYTEVGRPDLYREADVSFLTSDQFGYVAGVDGMMMRELPGAVFLQGYFFAESLILAETGHSVGAIQIAGTTAVTQLPFFVTACDYTLIGEEMYAASAYLDRDPPLLGSIKGGDLTKAVIMGLMIAAALAGSIGLLFTRHLGWHGLEHWFDRLVGWFDVA